MASEAKMAGKLFVYCALHKKTQKKLGIKERGHFGPLGRGAGWSCGDGWADPSYERGTLQLSNGPFIGPPGPGRIRGPIIQQSKNNQKLMGPLDICTYIQ